MIRRRNRSNYQSDLCIKTDKGGGFSAPLPVASCLVNTSQRCLSPIGWSFRSYSYPIIKELINENTEVP